MITLASIMFACIAVTAASAAAHPAHNSVAEIEWNPATHCFEVAIRISAADLTDALSVRLNRRVNLERAEDVESEVTDYVRRHFSVSTDDSDHEDDTKVSPLNWLGYEIELHNVWLYFELPDTLKFERCHSEPDTTVGSRRPLAKLLPDESEKNSSRTAAPELARKPVKVRIRNTLLLDVCPEQTNVVVFRHGNQVESTHHDRTNPAKEVDLTQNQNSLGAADQSEVTGAE